MIPLARAGYGSLTPSVRGTPISPGVALMPDRRLGMPGSAGEAPCGCMLAER